MVTCMVVHVYLYKLGIELCANGARARVAGNEQWAAMKGEPPFFAFARHWIHFKGKERKAPPVPLSREKKLNRRTLQPTNNHLTSGAQAWGRSTINGWRALCFYFRVF